MLILLTNDDGIQAPGLVAMYRELTKLGEVQVIAPETVVGWAVTAHNLGFRVVVPGLLNNILALSLRLMPHRISAQVQGILFYPRNR